MLTNFHSTARQLRKSLANPKHPMHKFGTGNLNTLCNNTLTGTSATHCHGTRKALLKFYNEHYSPKRMRLAVLRCQKSPKMGLIQRKRDRLLTHTH